MKTLLAVFLTIFACASVGFGCTLAPRVTDKFDTEQYVFIGDVAEIVSKKYSTNDYFYDAETRRYEVKKITKDGYGVRIRVRENIFLPHAQNSYNVFPLRLTASCGAVGWEKTDVLEAFPVGSKVAVVAEEAAGDYADADTKVLVTFIQSGSIARIVSNDGNPLTSAGSFFNYRDLKEGNYGDVRHSLLDFELAKDLLRLQNAAIIEDKINILERLLYYPHQWTLDFPEIVKREIKDENIAEDLTAQWEERKQKRLNNK